MGWFSRVFRGGEQNQPEAQQSTATVSGDVSYASVATEPPSINETSSAQVNRSSETEMSENSRPSIGGVTRGPASWRQLPMSGLASHRAMPVTANNQVHRSLASHTQADQLCTSSSGLAHAVDPDLGGSVTSLLQPVIGTGGNALSNEQTTTSQPQAGFSHAIGSDLVLRRAVAPSAIEQGAADVAPLIRRVASVPNMAMPVSASSTSASADVATPGSAAFVAPSLVAASADMPVIRRVASTESVGELIRERGEARSTNESNIAESSATESSATEAGATESFGTNVPSVEKQFAPTVDTATPPGMLQNFSTPTNVSTEPINSATPPAQTVRRMRAVEVKSTFDPITPESFLRKSSLETPTEQQSSNVREQTISRIADTAADVPTAPVASAQQTTPKSIVGGPAQNEADISRVTDAAKSSTEEVVSRVDAPLSGSTPELRRISDSLVAASNNEATSSTETGDLADLPLVARSTDNASIDTAQPATTRTYEWSPAEPTDRGLVVESGTSSGVDTTSGSASSSQISRIVDLPSAQGIDQPSSIVDTANLSTATPPVVRRTVGLGEPLNAMPATAFSPFDFDADADDAHDQFNDRMDLPLQRADRAEPSNSRSSDTSSFTSASATTGGESHSVVHRSVSDSPIAITSEANTHSPAANVAASVQSNEDIQRFVMRSASTHGQQEVNPPIGTAHTLQRSSSSAARPPDRPLIGKLSRVAASDSPSLLSESVETPPVVAQLRRTPAFVQSESQPPLQRHSEQVRSNESQVSDSNPVAGAEKTSAESTWEGPTNPTPNTAAVGTLARSSASTDESFQTTIASPPSDVFRTFEAVRTDSEAISSPSQVSAPALQRTSGPSFPSSSASAIPHSLETNSGGSGSTAATPSSTLAFRSTQDTIRRSPGSTDPVPVTRTHMNESSHDNATPSSGTYSSFSETPLGSVATLQRNAEETYAPEMTVRRAVVASVSEAAVSRFDGPVQRLYADPDPSPASTVWASPQADASQISRTTDSSTPAAPSESGGGNTTGAPPPVGGPDIDQLAQTLYERIRLKIRRELLDDRERAGLLLDRMR
jgi:hypothetical protein